MHKLSLVWLRKSSNLYSDIFQVFFKKGINSAINVAELIIFHGRNTTSL